MGCKSSKHPIPADPVNDATTSSSWEEVAKQTKAPRPLSDFEILIEKDQGEGLGVKLDPFEGTYLMVTALANSGVIPQYNKTAANADKLCPGDKIVVVNGAYGDAALMMDGLKESSVGLSIVRGARTEPAPEEEESTSAETIVERNEDPAPPVKHEQDVEDPTWQVDWDGGVNVRAEPSKTAIKIGWKAYGAVVQGKEVGDGTWIQFTTEPGYCIKEEAGDILLKNVDPNAIQETQNAPWTWTEKGISFMREANQHDVYGFPEPRAILTAEHIQKLKDSGIWTAAIERAVITDGSSDPMAAARRDKRSDVPDLKKRVHSKKGCDAVCG